MMIYFSILIVSLFVIYHFFSKKIYHFSFVVLALTSPLSLMTPDMVLPIFFEPSQVDKYLLVSICFLLGIYYLYMLIDSKEEDIRDSKWVLVLSLLLLINSFEFKLISLVFVSVIVWIKNRADTVYVDLKLISIFFLVFILKIEHLPFRYEFSIFVLSIVAIYLCIKNQSILELFVLLLATSTTSFKFDQYIHFYIMAPIILFLALPYFLDARTWNIFVSFFCESSFIKKILVKLSWRKGFEIPNPFILEAHSNEVTKVKIHLKYFEHKSDILMGAFLALLTLICAFWLV